MKILKKKPEISKNSISYYKFKSKKLKQKYRQCRLRPMLPSFTGFIKKSVALKRGRCLPEDSKVFKREIFALLFTYQSSYQADDYNFVYKISC